jgi:predicted RND superfamily exporter protein
MLTVLIAVIWSVGAMPLFGMKLSIISTVLPVILVAVGSAYGIHVVTHYITDKGNRQLNREEHHLFVIEVLRKIVKPVFLAAITTFAGFFSLCFTAVAPIREFGYFASFGVMAAFIVAVTLIPCLLIIKGPEKKKGSEKEDTYSAVISDTLMIVARKRRTVLSAAALVFILSIYGLSKIITDNAMIEYFKPETGVFQSDLFIRENFGGSKVVNVVLEGVSHEIILHPGTLTALDGLGEYLAKDPNVGKLMGFTDMVKRINQVINADADPAGLPKTEEDTFVLDDDFGFGFGFGDFQESPVVSNTPSAPPKTDRILTEGEFFALLDRAAGESRALSANDLAKALKRQVNYEGAAY